MRLPPQDAAPRAEPPASAPRELTSRALATGLGLGLLLAVTNVLMGLRTGWWDTGHVTASVLGFALPAAFAHRRDRPGPLETNVVQSTATAVGAAPATLGLLGAIPALGLMGHAPPAWAVGALGLALGVLGILGALAVRRRLLEEERLPFPSGVAAAEVIRALHGGALGPGPARALLATGGLAAVVAGLRDLVQVVPGVLFLPVNVAGAPAAAYGLGLAASPMLAGAGLVAGVRTGLSVLLGGLMAWAFLAPRLVASGAVAAAEFGPLVAWLAWPGAALVLGAGIVSLASQWRVVPGALRDAARLGSRARRRSPAALALAAAAAALALGVMIGVFGVGPGRALLALLLGALLSLACVRAAGQTDILPAGELAQVEQVALGAWTSGAANVAGATFTAGVSAQGGVALWSLRAGQLLGARAELQARAMLAGALLGAAVSVPLYAVLDRAYVVGSSALPAPGAAPWRAVAELVTRGEAALPPGAGTAALVALAAGAALELLGRRWRVLPSAGALGMGFIAPLHFGAALCVGAVAGAGWRRVHPASAEGLSASVGAGAIAGDSLASAVAAVVRAAGG